MKKDKINEDLDLKAVFLGPKSENKDTFEKYLHMMFEDHSEWRKNYHPEDDEIINSREQRTEEFQESVDKMEDVLKELSRRLRSQSLPWHSPRFLGHMNSETLMPAILGYFGAMLYNGNNVAYESSPGTSQMEEEVGEDFAKLMGYKEDIGWGHICADGSIANLEGIWYARNIKSLPLAMKEVTPELVEGKDEWQLLNMSVSEILDLVEKVPDKLDELKDHSARQGTEKIEKLGKWIIPQTKHYSWLKAGDIIGIGLENVEAVEVNEKFRMDIPLLEKKIRELAEKKIPIMGVVGVVGSTEEGAVDDIHKIIELRDKFAKEGIHFYVHVDAAYGGYARSIFLDEDFGFIPKEDLKKKYLEHNVILDENTRWPEDDTYEAFKAISEADTVTIDPHKMGYIPYSAGGIVIKDKRMRDSISYFATYVFEKGMDIPALLGAFMLEGSKAGATAAGVWAAHKTLPLNITGYGKLIGASIEGAMNLYEYFSDKKFIINGKEVILHTLIRPDFNMVDFAFNEVGNTDLEKMNELNHDFYEEASYVKGGLYSNDFITSHTDFAVPDYGNSPFGFVNRIGMNRDEWDKVQKVTVLRACVLSPFLNDKEVFNEYMEKVEKAIGEKLEKIISK
ncbi:tyrosine decarboxylase [uncultured Clostridium sp.]|uniref:tyrosine decarboxylase n=1 Tax=uncultured Clostridium sp. TaxID=59620 RepID=UPI00261DDAAD|nr:tyrosine decarboxylase [uncultured Clostridium sp.]